MKMGRINAYIQQMNEFSEKKTVPSPDKVLSGSSGIQTNTPVSSIGMAAVVGSGAELFEEDETRSSMYEGTGKTGDAEIVETQEEVAKEESKELEETTNRMTDEEYAQLREEGIRVEELTPDQLASAIERIRIGKELQQKALSGQQQKILEAREAAIKAVKKMLPDHPQAERIADHLLNAGVPVTKNTVTRMVQALELSTAIAEMTDGADHYLIRKGLEPTMQNVYRATHSSKANRKADVMQDEVWASLQDNITKVIERSGYSADEETLADAKWLLCNRLPVTEKNIQQKKVLNELRSRSTDEVLELTAATIADGMEVEDTDLSCATKSETADKVKMIHSLSGEAVDAALGKKQGTFASEIAANAIPDEAMELHMSELRREKAYADKNGSYDMPSEPFSSIEFSYASVRAKRQLEEIRLKLTVESGYRLERQGIRLDTAKLSEIVSGLRRIEESYYEHYMRGHGMANNAELREIFQKTVENMHQLAEVPSYTLAETFDQRDTISLEELTNTGTTLKARYDKAGEAYEMLRTTPRHDLGDTLTKAFKGVENMLHDMGIPETEENCRAVRILGYNSMSITEEHISQIKDYDKKVNTLLEKLHPGAVLKMIKDGINPLNETVDSLIERVNRIREEEGLNETERFSNYLVQVEKNGSIGEEERKTYISLYRLFHKLEESGGAAAGSVLRNGQELTLSNLLQAVRTSRRNIVDISIDDSFEDKDLKKMHLQPSEDKLLEGLKESAASADITIQESYKAYENAQTGDKMASERVSEMRTAAEDSTEAMQFLEKVGLPKSMENIMAAKEFLQGDGKLYKDLNKLKKTYFTPQQAAEADNVPSTEDCFSEKGAETLYQNLEQVTEKLQEAMFASDRTSSMDLNMLRHCVSGVRFLKETAKRESFDFPMETEDGIRNLRVTFAHAMGENGNVTMQIPFEKLGTIYAELTMQNNMLNCFISSDSQEGTRVLKHNTGELVGALEATGVAVGRVYFATGRTSSQPGRPEGIYTEGDAASLGQMGQEKVSTEKLFQIAKVVYTYTSAEEKRA